MMGDNRHNSADSRFWGFVPEDHIVGKASLSGCRSTPQALPGEHPLGTDIQKGAVGWTTTVI